VRFNPFFANCAIAAAALAPPSALRAQGAEEAFNTSFRQAVYAQNAKNFALAETSFLETLHQAARFGPEDARMGVTLNSLAMVYAEEKKLAPAEESCRRALAILGKTSGENSIDVGDANFNLSTILMQEGRHAQAIPYMQRTLLTYETMLGGGDVKTAAALCMLGDLYRIAKSYKQAEEPLRRCAAIREADGGMQNALLADALHSLALTYEGEGNYALAEPRFTLAEKIRQNTLGITSPLLALTMEDHAALLKRMGRDKEAARLAVLSGAIRRSEKKEK
jgi:tetratricopeptide (TPR) repeat protein